MQSIYEALIGRYIQMPSMPNNPDIVTVRVMIDPLDRTPLCLRISDDGKIWYHIHQSEIVSMEEVGPDTIVMRVTAQVANNLNLEIVDD